MGKVNNENGGFWASWYQLGLKNSTGEYHDGRVQNTMGGREELDELEAKDHAAARRKMNPSYAPSESEVKRRQEARETAEEIRAANEQLSKMKVDGREASKSRNLHSYRDSFEPSHSTGEHVNFAKMAALVAGSKMA